MALLLELNITLSVFFISLIVSLLLLLLQKRASLSSDALLGLLAHATLAVGLVVLAFMTWVRVDLMGFLFGDILAVTTNDLAVIWFGGMVVLIGLSFIWRRLFAATVNYELAKAEGAKPDLTNIVFMVLVAGGNCRFDETSWRASHHRSSYYSCCDSQTFFHIPRTYGDYSGCYRCAFGSCGSEWIAEMGYTCWSEHCCCSTCRVHHFRSSNSKTHGKKRFAYFRSKEEL